METNKTMASLTLIFSLLLILIASASQPAAAAYTNHTVGGSAGWFFSTKTNTSSTDYSAWAANQTFNLGDFLIFNTSTNQSVIQTYNQTTYRNCTFDESEDDDTFSFSSGSNQFGQSLTVAVRLTMEGLNHYFSDADNGMQCQQGMSFEINVKHGSGLPPSLNQPPPPAYVEPPSSGDDSQPPPVTIAANTPPSDNEARAAGANVRWGGGLCSIMWIVDCYGALVRAMRVKFLSF